MPTSPPPYAHLDQVNGVAVVRVQSHEIRHPEQALEFGEQLNRLVEQEGHNRLVLDLHKNAYLCSTALGVLITLARKAAAAGGRVAICRMDPHVRIVANIARLPEVIPIFDDERAALDAV